MQSEAIRKEMTCPHTGTECVDGIRDDFKPGKDGRVKPCRLWIHMYGKDPQSEKIYDQFDCSHAWLAVTTVEQAQMARFTTASVDKVANEISDIGGKIRLSFTDMVNAFLHMAETNREMLEFKKNEPSILEIPTNGKHTGGQDGNRLE
jgi:hypothetical protein